MVHDTNLTAAVAFQYCVAYTALCFYGLEHFLRLNVLPRREEWSHCELFGMNFDPEVPHQLQSLAHQCVYRRRDLESRIGIAMSLSLNGCNNLCYYPFALSGRSSLGYLLSTNMESDCCLLEDWASFLDFRTQSQRMGVKGSSVFSNDVVLLSETNGMLKRLPCCDHCLVYGSLWACLTAHMYCSTANGIDKLLMMACFAGNRSTVSPLIAKLMNFYLFVSYLIPSLEVAETLSQLILCFYALQKFETFHVVFLHQSSVS